MRWRGRRQSENVEDARLSGGRGATAVGGGVGVLLIALLLSVVFGIDPQALLQQGGGGVQPPPNAAAPGEELSPKEVELGEFVGVVLADSEDVWHELYPKMSGRPYQEPGLKLFRDEVRSGCGVASSAMGPFYCPADNKVYLDTQFFYQLAEQLNAPGDFAQAYVIAHEVGHHIQNLLGTSGKVARLRQTLDEAEYNKYSVRLELQADFYAGVMFHHAQRNKNILEEGDIEEGIRAAAAIGDDTLQRQSRGYANQETFTHGTSEQRVRWFMKGLRTGDPSQGDTFSAERL